MSRRRPSRPRPIEDRIQERYAELPPSERVLADLILNFPGELASYSATELTALAKVSKAVASRLVRRLGYESYDEARRDARNAQKWGSPRYLNSPSLEGRALVEAGQAHLECEIANLRATLAGCSENIDAIAQQLATARRVFCIGFRTSHMLADYLRWLLIQVRADVRLLPVAGETLSEYLSELAEGDVLVAVGLRRRVPALRLALEAAGTIGAKILLLADPTAGPLSGLATWTIICEGRSTSAFVSDVSAMSVIHFLGSRVAERLGRASRERMRVIEALHDKLEELER